MLNPLLNITRLVEITDKYSRKLMKAKKLDTFSLRETRHHHLTGKKYNILDISTEKSLAEFIRDNYGYGLFSVVGYIKKRKGCFVFWKGEITKEYWVFIPNESLTKEDKKEVDIFEKQIITAQTDEEAREYEDYIKEIKSEAKDIKKGKRYGFADWLIPSGRRGEPHYWDDKDVYEKDIKQKEYFSVPEIFDIKKEKTNKKFEDMNVEDINKF